MAAPCSTLDSLTFLPVRVSIVDYSPLGVDTPEDLQRVREIMEGPGAGP